MKIVGLTGGIGTGKTYISNIFKEKYFVSVYNSDLEAKKLMMEDNDLKKKIINLLGEESYHSLGLNKDYISKKIFNNKELRYKLNAIVHPKVKEDFNFWVLKQRCSYVIKESAILFESNIYLDCDYVITVLSDLEERIERVHKRDSHTKEYILKIIESQIDDNFKILKSDFVIRNSKNDDLLLQIDNINKILVNEKK